jgi:hypothetical protein
MQTTKVACPLCHGVFAIADASPLGKSIRCQKCGAPFSVAMDDLCGLADISPLPIAEVIPEPMADTTPWWISVQETASQPAAPVAAPTSPPSALPAKAAIQPSAVPGRLANHATPSQSRLIALGAIVAALTTLLGVTVAVAVVYLSTTSDQRGIAQAADQEPLVQPAPAPLPHDDDGINQPNLELPKPRPPQEDPPPAHPPEADPKEPAPKPAEPAVPPPVATKKKPAVPIQQKLIDEAIGRGVAFLKGAQSKDGSWLAFASPKKNIITGSYPLGPTALAGLTLLECGAAPTDPEVVKPANFIRRYWQANKQTYELSLILLFLDRLGEKKDKALIRSVAMRLIAGQTPNGGWSYTCPLLTSQQETQLLTALNKDRPKPLPTATDKGAKPGLTLPLDKVPQQILPAPVDKNDKSPIPNGTPTQPVPPLKPPPSADSGKGSEESWDEEDEPVLVATQPPGGKGQPGKLPSIFSPNGVIDDNSNTQFAMLALWAARRHDLPVEKSLALSDLRFRVSQLTNGAWAYRFHDPDDRARPSMTSVGLLGLALGQGVAAESAIRATKAGKAQGAGAKPGGLDDEARRGFQALNLDSDKIAYQSNSLYFIWSVERIGVLYNVTKIGGRDWYQWGAGMLLPAQNGNGSWETHSFVGSNSTIDTCFALLFLKRANLAQDLTDLNLFLAIPASPKN